MKRLILILVPLLCLLGCATKPDRQGRLALDASLFREGSVFVYLGTGMARESTQAVTESESLADRVDHIVLDLDGPYPLAEDSSQFAALVYGDIPRVGLTLAARSNDDIVKDAAGFYRMGPVSYGLVAKGVLLVTNRDWIAERTRLQEKPGILDPLVVEDLEQGEASVYALHPHTFFDLGTGVAPEVVDMMEEVTGRLDGTKVDLRIVADTDGHASALDRALRSAVVADLRSQRIKPDVKELRNVFTLQGNLLTITSLELPSFLKESLRR